MSGDKHRQDEYSHMHEQYSILNVQKKKPSVLERRRQVSQQTWHTGLAVHKCDWSRGKLRPDDGYHEGMVGCVGKDSGALVRSWVPGW